MHLGPGVLGEAEELPVDPVGDPALWDDVEDDAREAEGDEGEEGEERSEASQGKRFFRHFVLRKRFIHVNGSGKRLVRYPRLEDILPKNTRG